MFFVTTSPSIIYHSGSGRCLTSTMHHVIYDFFFFLPMAVLNLKIFMAVVLNCEIHKPTVAMRKL